MIKATTVQVTKKATFKNGTVKNCITSTMKDSNVPIKLSIKSNNHKANNCITLSVSLLTHPLKWYAPNSLASHRNLFEINKNCFSLSLPMHRKYHKTKKEKQRK